MPMSLRYLSFFLKKTRIAVLGWNGSGDVPRRWIALITAGAALKN
jgi:hypothetical protein